MTKSQGTSGESWWTCGTNFQPQLKTRRLRMDAFPLIEVVPIDGKGLGVKAVTDIRANTLIISEEPILMGPSAAGMILGQFNTRVPVTQANEMAARLKTRSAEDLRMFLGCTNAHPKLNPFLGIFRTNALPILCGDEKKGGFFPIACRINHSCAPNSLNTWNNDLLRLGESLFLSLASLAI